MYILALITGSVFFFFFFVFGSLIQTVSLRWIKEESPRVPGWQDAGANAALASGCLGPGILFISRCACMILFNSLLKGERKNLLCQVQLGGAFDTLVIYI